MHINVNLFQNFIFMFYQKFVIELQIFRNTVSAICDWTMNQ
jgi:hypothetical protein